MKKLPIISALAICLAFPAFSESSPLRKIEDARAVLGGSVMTDSATVMDNIKRSLIHTRITGFLVDSGLHELLSGPGPVTLFAPEDTGFLPLEGDMIKGSTLDPDKYARSHIVRGDFSLREIRRKIRPDGFLHLTTFAGTPLSLQVVGGQIWLHDETGRASRITDAGIPSRNGTIHSVRRVMPADRTKWGTVQPMGGESSVSPLIPAGEAVPHDQEVIFDQPVEDEPIAEIPAEADTSAQAVKPIPGLRRVVPGQNEQKGSGNAAD